MTAFAKILLGLVVITLVVSGYFYFFWTPSQTPLPAPSAPKQASTTEAAPAVTPKTPAKSTVQKTTEVTVEMIPDAFKPQTLAIKVGTTIRFVNHDKVDRWPISNLETTQALCPGFDAKQSVKPGGSYRFTFNIEKFCYYHDHLNPAIKAVIVVNPK